MAFYKFIFCYLVRNWDMFYAGVEVLLTQFKYATTLRKFDNVNSLIIFDFEKFLGFDKSLMEESTMVLIK